MDWDTYERYRSVLAAQAEVNASIAATNAANPNRQRPFVEL